MSAAPIQAELAYLGYTVAELTVALTFCLLFVFVVLRHDRRELVHVDVTDHPTAAWARQIVEAFPEETAPKYLLRFAIETRSRARPSLGASTPWGSGR